MDKALLDLNTIGTISVTKAVLPQVVKQKKGLIVIVSSIAGKLGWFTCFCDKCINACVCYRICSSGQVYHVVQCIQPVNTLYRLVYQLQSTIHSACTQLVTPSPSSM